MNQEQLETMRHSAAHLMAAAAQSLFPEAKFGVGPIVENGFYYDIELPRALTPLDLQKIEKRMKDLQQQKIPFVREEMSIDEAIKFFESLGQKYKVDLLNDLKKFGTTKLKDAKESETVAAEGGKATIYKTGKFVDLCRGPHVATTKDVGVFKLHKLAGAYWRGDQAREQLQRVYGLAFATQKELEDYLKLLEEAEKRDHRKIGAEQELFFVDDMVGKGLILWQPNGTIIRNEIEKLAVEKEKEYGYVRVVTPHLAKEQLFLTSGHLPYYKDSMYPAMVMDDGTYYMKAMNCPHHHVIYNHGLHSYRELPIRIAEYGTCYRNELSGTLAGLLRVRCLAMNDAHMYCRKDQIKDEFKRVMKLTMELFKIFGLKDFWFRLSRWSPEHLEKYINEPKNWDYAEGVIRDVLKEMKVKFVEVVDEAAFYGPKVDVQFKSVIGREETMSTIQLDFAAKQRFNLKYIDESGKENNEVFVIHRAPLSTHERFTAFLIEHYAGIWPVWLAPVQVALIPVGQGHVKAAKKLAEILNEAGIRVEVYNLNETVGYKIRKAEKQKVPYMLVLGDKEAGKTKEIKTLMVRVRGQEKLLKISTKKFIEKIKGEIANRS